MKRIIILSSLLAALVLASVAGAKSRGNIQIIGFHTPSKNIFCMWLKMDNYSPSVRCDIVSGLKPMPAQPSSCTEGSVGSTLEVSAVPKAGEVKNVGPDASLGCVSDAVDRAGKVLNYGKSFTKGGITCLSAFTGLTCKNAHGHGFFLARQSYRIF